MAKKKVIKKKSPEINIKFKNIDGKNLCSRSKGKIIYHKHSSHFWIFGSALAMILSYERSASILYAILHGILSWFYILFRTIQMLN